MLSCNLLLSGKTRYDLDMLLVLLLQKMGLVLVLTCNMVAIQLSLITKLLKDSQMV